MTTDFENCNPPKKRYSLLKKKKFLSIAFLGFGFLSPFQATANMDYSTLGYFLNKNAEFQHYMEMPLRQKLSVAENNNLSNIAASDASNWTGCQVGKGILSGTARDISACAASVYLKKEVSIDEMARLSYQEASNIIEFIWDGIKASAIPDQSVANLVMHIQMHYGNIRLVQKGLNLMGCQLTLNGRMDNATLQALAKHSFWNPNRTYNHIRMALKAAYRKSPYRKAFLRALRLEFPNKIDHLAVLSDSLQYCKQELDCQANSILNTVNRWGFDLDRAA